MSGTGNFSKIKQFFPEMGAEAESAEQLIGKDNLSSGTRYRRFLEVFIDEVISKVLNDDVSKYKKLSLAGKFDFVYKNFPKTIPSDISRDCKGLRLSGNSTVHHSDDDLNSPAKTNVLIQNNFRAYKLGQWLLTTLGYSADSIDSYKEPVLNEALAQNISRIVQNDVPDLRLIDFYGDITLNADQKKAVDALQGFLDDNTARVFALYGYAGTGKTTLMKGLCEYLFSSGNSNAWLLAPTGKAANVLMAKTGLPAKTIHSHIYEIIEDKISEKFELEKPELPRIQGRLKVLPEELKNPILIVDEASMIGDSENADDDAVNDLSSIKFGSGKLLKDLLTFAHATDSDFTGKIIFVGDEAQLPPVGAKVSPAFDFSYLEEEYKLKSTGYKLTEVVRPKGDNGVLSLANELHKDIETSSFSKLAIQFSNDVRKAEKDDIISIFDEGWKHKPQKPVAIIAQTNADVFLYNQMVRKRYFKSEGPDSPA